MEKLLSNIYYGQIDYASQKPPIAPSKDEQHLYNKLEKSFSKEQFELFQDFLECYTDRYSDYQEYAFKQGVKFGFNLIKEINEI